MTSNRAVVFQGTHKMSVETIDYPKMEAKGRPVQHGVILKILATAICGSDLHIYRGRTDMMPGQPVGHEITGMVIEKGNDVEQLQIGDIVSVPFNVSCGRCRNCKTQDVHLCLTTNDLKPGAAYGYPEMGPWQGGQAEYVFVPYADFNLLKFPDRDQALEKLPELAMLADIFPTGYHGATEAGVGPGKTVYIAGAGPVGLCAAIASYLKGAACVIIGDVNHERVEHAKATIGCEGLRLGEVDVIPEQIHQILGTPEVDCAIDAIGYEAHGHGDDSDEPCSTDALDTTIDVMRAGGRIGVPGVYLPVDPKGQGKLTKMGRPPSEWGRAWDKALTMSTGQAPVARYNRDLMTAILFERVRLSRALGTTIISMEEAPEAYARFNDGVPQKFLIDPHGVMRQPERKDQLLATAGREEQR